MFTHIFGRDYVALRFCKFTCWFRLCRKTQLLTVNVCVSVSAVPAGTISGGVGTLKRKRGLRDIMESLDKDHHDDIFDSTPHRKRLKHTNVSLLSSAVTTHAKTLYSTLSTVVCC